MRILLADDHSLARQGFRRVLEREPDLRVVGEVADGRMAVSMALELVPDVILMDVTMPGLNGIEATREIRHRLPGVRVVGVSMHRDGVYVREMLKAGASGYVLKECSETELVQAVREVQGGKSWLSIDVREVGAEWARRQADDPLELLSSREREVFQHMAVGRSNLEIARLLNLSVYTVEAHRGRVMEKLNLHSGDELLRFAAGLGMA